MHKACTQSKLKLQSLLHLYSYKTNLPSQPCSLKLSDVRIWEVPGFKSYGIWFCCVYSGVFGGRETLEVLRGRRGICWRSRGRFCGLVQCLWRDVFLFCVRFLRLLYCLNCIVIFLICTLPVYCQFFISYKTFIYWLKKKKKESDPKLRSTQKRQPSEGPSLPKYSSKEITPPPEYEEHGRRIENQNCLSDSDSKSTYPLLHPVGYVNEGGKRKPTLDPTSNH